MVYVNLTAKKFVEFWKKIALKTVDRAGSVWNTSGEEVMKRNMKFFFAGKPFLLRSVITKKG